MAYPDSKLLLSMWVRELSLHVSPKLVLVNSLCPGLVQTDFERNSGGILKFIAGIVRRLIGRSLEAGARTLVFAGALAGEDTHGELVADNKVKSATPFILSEEGSAMQKKLWEETVAVADELKSAPSS